MKLRYKILIGIVVFILLTPLWVYIWFQTRPPWIESPLQEISLELKRGFLADDDLGPESEFEVIRQLRNAPSLDVAKHPKETDFEYSESAKHWSYTLWRGDKHQMMALAWGKDSFPIVKSISSKMKQGIPTASSMSLEDAGDYFGLVKQVGQANLLLADKLFAEKKITDALQINRNVRRLGSAVSRGGAIINHMIAVSLNVSATRQLRKWVMTSSEAIPSALAIQTANELLVEAKEREPAQECIRAEYHIMNGVLDQMFSGELSDGPSRMDMDKALKLWRITGSSVEETKQNFKDIFALMVLCLPLDAKQEHLDAWNKFEAHLFDKSHIYKRRNPLGLFLASMILPATHMAVNKLRESDIHLQGTATILAMHAYRMETGHQPKNLDALVPNYMTALPTDIFSQAKPMTYKLKTDGHWTLYSVGKDRQDNGGKRQLPSSYSYNINIGTTRDKGFDAVFISNEFELLKEAHQGAK